MRLIFNDPAEQGRRKPDHHIADVDIVFDQTDGPLAGLKLVGTALWSRTDGEEGVTVTLPSRKVGGSGKQKDWFYELLRTDEGNAEQLKAFKAYVVSAWLARDERQAAHA